MMTTGIFASATTALFASLLLRAKSSTALWKAERVPGEVNMFGKSSMSRRLRLCGTAGSFEVEGFANAVSVAGALLFAFGGSLLSDLTSVGTAI